MSAQKMPVYDSTAAYGMSKAVLPMGKENQIIVQRKTEDCIYVTKLTICFCLCTLYIIYTFIIEDLEMFFFEYEYDY